VSPLNKPLKDEQGMPLSDETITEHLDIESIVFLSERLGQLLCEDLIT